MAYTEKFQHLADLAMSQVASVEPTQVNTLIAQGAIALDIRDKEEYEADHLEGSLHVSRGKLEMNIEGLIPDLNTLVLCYCNANNRGALSANTLRQMGYNNVRYIAGGLKACRALVWLKNFRLNRYTHELLCNGAVRLNRLGYSTSCRGLVDPFRIYNRYKAFHEFGE